MFGELNKTKKVTVNPEISTEDIPFVKLKDICGQSVRIWGFWINECGKYKPQVVLVTKDFLINMPPRYTEEFREYLNNDNYLSAIVNGGMVLTNIRMVSTKSGNATCVFDYADYEDIKDSL